MEQVEETRSSEYSGSRAANDKTPLIRGKSTQSINGAASDGTSGRMTNTEGYEELFKDSAPCPTCRGLGRVSKAQEGELVALIPMKDKRLKPRRTVLYVAVATFICVVIAGLCMFFLFPRDVVVTSDHPPFLEPIFVNLNLSAYYVNFTVRNFYYFSNNNFYNVKITGAQVVSFYDQKVMSISLNKTEVNIPMRSTITYGIEMNFFLSSTNDWGFLVKFCEDPRSWVHNLPLTLELTANYTYLGHVEQATLMTYQSVSCYNNSAPV
ncbi:transmembrane protein 106B-like [Pomacea canaliculata]|uniref:transmembrane protein 106B-like n=1 Tax=Pomacea canaliculata TaxID=400727 RepID=UPI000D73E52C|nr:transmembrane protein 106B-like [Pomacea canaliculata]